MNFYQEDNLHTLKAGGGMVKIECLRKKSVFVVSCFVTNTINLEALKQLTFIMAVFPWIRRPAWLNWILSSGSLTQGVGQEWSHLSLGKLFPVTAEFSSEKV